MRGHEAINCPEPLAIFWARTLSHRALASIDSHLVEAFVSLGRGKSDFTSVRVEQQFPFHK